MALKGKKKSRARGSQARRRPASAPRPSQAAVKRRWYQTTAGLTIASLGTILVLALVTWLIADNRSDAAALKSDRKQVETVTEQMKSVFNLLSGPAAEMPAAADLSSKELAKKTKGWEEQVTQAQATIGAMGQASGLESVTGLLQQGAVLYTAVGEEYKLAAELEGDARERATANATRLLTSAEQIFVTATTLLDERRAELDLDASGLTSPAAAAPPPAPAPAASAGTSTEIQIPAEGSKKGSKGSQGSKKGSKGSS